MQSTSFAQLIHETPINLTEGPSFVPKHNRSTINLIKDKQREKDYSNE